MPSPRVLIGIPCRTYGGFRPFDMVLHQLMFGRTDLEVFYALNGVLPGCRNRIVREALRVGAEYIWMLDEDQPFDPGDRSRPSDLDKLLAHRLDAVIPLSCRRGSPFLPILFSHLGDSGRIASQRYLRDDEDGLIRVAAAGFGGLLIKTDCFTRIGADGWFEFVHAPGDWDNYAEDFPFYLRLAQAGISLYCDLDVRFGHAVNCVAYIMKQQGHWVTVMADQEPFCAFPQQSNPLELPRERPRTKILASSIQ